VGGGVVGAGLGGRGLDDLVGDGFGLVEVATRGNWFTMVTGPLGAGRCFADAVGRGLGVFAGDGSAANGLG